MEVPGGGRADYSPPLRVHANSSDSSPHAQAAATMAQAPGGVGIQNLADDLLLKIFGLLPP